MGLISSATVGDPRKALSFIKAKGSHTVMVTPLETPLESIFISLFLSQNVSWSRVVYVSEYGAVSLYHNMLLQ